MNNKHTILYKYFFIVLSISIFVAIVGLFASYRFTELVIVEQVNEKSIEQLEQVRSVFNSVHFSNIPAAVQLSRDRLINELMYSSNVTKNEILQALSRLNTAKLSNPLISSIIVYNHLNHRFYSTQEGIIERDDFQDRQLIEMLDNAKEFGLYRYIPRINNNDETVFTLLLGTMPTSGKSLKGAMITNISERALRLLLSSSASKLTGELIIYDRDGMILSHSQKELFSQQDKSSVYIQQLISDRSERGTFVFYDENIKMLLTYIRYVDFGWIFVTLTPYEDILHSVYIARNRVLTVLFFMLLISLIVAFIVSRYLYQPIGIIRNFALEVDNEYSPLKKTENLSDELEKSYKEFKKILEDIEKYSYEDFLLMSRIMVYQFQNSFRQEKYPQGAYVLSSIRVRVNHFESILEFEKSIKEIIEIIIKEKFNINSQKTNELSLRAKEMIDENINECNLCSKWLSSQLEISTNYLRTVFRDFQGSSISEYINGKRIIYGQVLLKTTDIPVKELYLRLGFSNYNYFFTIFRKYTGVTPVQYKRKARTDKIEVIEAFQN